MRVVLAVEVKRLPEDVDKAWSVPDEDRSARAATPKQPQLAANGS